MNQHKLRIFRNTIYKYRLRRLRNRPYKLTHSKIHLNSNLFKLSQINRKLLVKNKHFVLYCQ